MIPALSNKFFVLRYHKPNSNAWSAYGNDQSGFFISHVSTAGLLNADYYIFNRHELHKLDLSQIATPGTYGFDPDFAHRKVIPTDNFVRDRRALVRNMPINYHPSQSNQSNRSFIKKE